MYIKVLFLLRDIDEQWRGDTDRRVGSDNRTEEECEGESLQTLRTEEEHRENDDEDRERGEYRSTHCIVDRLINHLIKVELLIHRFMKRRTNTIHDDDGIIDRVAENREHCREEECIDLELREEV